jgi:thiol-disulfide isomerase/thioredoxin
MRKIFLFLLAVGFAANVVAQSGRRITNPPPPPPLPEPSAEAPLASRPEGLPSAPSELTVLPQSLLNRQLRSLDNGSFRLADFGGKVIVLNLWASWCGPCRMEVPEYEKVRKEYAGRGVEFIALTTEDPNTSFERVRRFVRDFNFGFRLGWADRETALTLMNGRNSIPQTLVMAPDGRIVGHWRGYSRGQSGDHLRDMIKRALSESSGSAQGFQ